MLKIFKWLWYKAETNAAQKIIDELGAFADYHKMKSEIEYLISKHEPRKPESPNPFPSQKLDPTQHEAVSNEIYKFIDLIERWRKNAKQD